ncbi:glycosyltransferase family protein [Butyrivibrio sp.]|jgi:hypothetical protein|uniref:glycosyltransferase family protein n=1 Tax=Butyrivibrio sp. TaxID=28121 RepID=UPI0025C5630A|nr:glycosyltransferase [Butyrivibrio sp.]MBE5837097.1 glycosyltransferase family 1 protein [Butyrivibrio sp.]
MHIILFQGRHAELSFFVGQYIKYIEESSTFEDYYVVDVNRPETYNCLEFDEYATRPETAMFTFNNIGVHLMADGGGNFWKENSIPVFDYIVDHPRNFEDTMLRPPCDLYVFALDRNHVDFIRKYYKLVKKVVFSPNGGTTSSEKIKRYTDRSIDVLYMGNCNERVDYYNSIDTLSDNGAELYRQVIGMMLNDTTITTEKAIEIYLLQNQNHISERDIYEVNRTAAWSIEATVRRITKLAGMKALSDAGVNVEVYGTGWEDENYPYGENIKINARIEPDRILDVLDDSKISLCFIPWFKRGCSEKNFNSMLHGAVCVTDFSEYLNEHYKNNKNIVYFDLNNPVKMAGDVVSLLNDPEKAENIAIEGYQTALKYDTWDNRYEVVTKEIRKVLLG